jgi:hypothetical protein
MDFYEELGLKRTASLQEIRQAYKVLARLVHPDGKEDEQVREMAQRQMQRLNEILAILTDERARRYYDATLMGAAIESSHLTPARPPESLSGNVTVRTLRSERRRQPWGGRLRNWASQLPGWAQATVRHSYWIALAMVFAILGVWYLAEDSKNPSHAGSVPEVTGSSPDLPQTARAASAKGARGTNRNPLTESAASSGQSAANAETAAVPPLPIQAPEPATAPETTVETAPEHLSEAALIEPSNSQPIVTAAAQTVPHPAFAGNWLYAPDPAETVAAGTYPATYVELLLAENQGQLSGKYRAHYRIADRAVSPELSFQIQGPTSGGRSAHLRWTSEDGAKGEMEMSLTGPNLMSVSWWSTSLGRYTAVASGTAKLVRQRVR